MKSKLTIKDLQALTLERGWHDSRAKGVCAMEAVAWLAGRAHSDRPPCVSPVLGNFVRSWNDGMADEPRQRLKAYLPRLLDTAGDAEADKQRAAMAWEWVLKVSVPTWLEAAGLEDHAEAVRRDGEKALEPARKAAYAAWDAARDAARDAAWAAARDAAWAAAGAALAPTVLALQESAFDLLDRMISAGEKVAS